MKRCPNCGELLLDATPICPVCGYRFESFNEKISDFQGGKKARLKNGGELLYWEKFLIDHYPPFLEEELPALVVGFKNMSDEDVVLKISAVIEDYAYENKRTLTIKSGEYVEYEYIPSFKKKRIKDLKNFGKSVLRYEVTGDLSNSVEETFPIVLLSYGDILWRVGDTSLAQYIVRWVTPGDEMIREKLLNRVMDEMEKIGEVMDYFRENGLGDKGMIFGYQLGIEGVYAQVWSLFNALKNWGIRYKSTPVSILEGFQRVRLPREVLKEKGGNCIDLTVTFASALEAMDLYPVIILIPGHAFPGVIIPREFAEGRNLSISKRIENRYLKTLKKYGVGTMKMDGESTLRALNEHLYPCCGSYILPVESTRIPTDDFMDAVRDITDTGKMDMVEEMVIVPEVRKKLGDKIVPYEGMEVSHPRKYGMG